MGLFDAQVQGTDYGHERRHAPTVMDGMVVRWTLPGLSSHTGVSASRDGVMVHGTGAMSPHSDAFREFHDLLMLAAVVSEWLASGRDVGELEWSALAAGLEAARAFSEAVTEGVME